MMTIPPILLFILFPPIPPTVKHQDRYYVVLLDNIKFISSKQNDHYLIQLSSFLDSCIEQFHQNLYHF
jgi:hypothetical protein